MKETKFDKNIHNELNSDFDGHILKVSTNYVDELRLLDNYLDAVYGEKIDREKMLNNYLCSSREIDSVDDIEEVSVEYIQELIKAEEDYSSKIIRLQEIAKVLAPVDWPLGNEKIRLLIEAIEIIGLTGKPNALLSEIINKDVGIVEKMAHSRSLTCALLMIFTITVMLYSSGMQLSFPNTGSIAMTQTKGRCFYRGENAYYKTSKAGCFRGKYWSELKEPGFDYVLWNLRLYECYGFFDHFDVVTHWNNLGFSDVNYLALAQHYGLRTQMLDITTSIKTALFFACCKSDSNGLDWHPLTSTDFERVDSRKGVAKLGGDSRYAVLHYVPTNIVDCQWLTMDEKNTGGLITPIGYQPFMRCSTQYGYMMHTDVSYDLMKDKLFRKVKFRLTEKFCNWIYEEMDRGKSIYPNDEDIVRIHDIVRIVSGMNGRTEFSRYTAENVRKHIGSMLVGASDGEVDPIYYYSMLKRQGIKIKDKVEILSDKNIGRINKRYTLDKVMSKIEAPQCRPMIAIG